MRPLETKFNRHGHAYEQIRRQGSVALFAVKSEFGGTLGYEVVKVKVAPAVFIKLTKTHVPERETYPSDEEFGTRGWYYPVEKKDLAEKKFTVVLMQTLAPVEA